MTKKQPVKKKVLKLKDKLSDTEREKVREFINDSRRVTNSVLECGSEMADVCHEVDRKGRNLGEMFGFSQDNWYSEFK